MSELQAPTRSMPLSRQVADQVAELISSGRWAVGTRLPPEHDLAAELGVSRNTVREALRALVYVGLLASRPGDGTYVQASSELEALLARRGRRGELDEIVEVRTLLEQRAAGLAAARRKDDDVDRLRALLDRQREFGDRPDSAEFVLADAELHRAVVVCAGNSVLTELYDSLGAARAESVAGLPVAHEGLVDEQRAQHSALIDAIAARDVAAAERAAARIVTASRDVEGHIEGAATRDGDTRPTSGRDDA